MTLIPPFTVTKHAKLFLKIIMYHNQNNFFRGCCSRLCSKLICCKGKDGSRRTSMNSKKQSIAPTNPPDDNRPKLDIALVEHSSMMKGAIPVLPICLAWFCGILNFIIPGSGKFLF